MAFTPGPERQKRAGYGGRCLWRRARSVTTRLAMLALTALAVVAPAAAGCDDDERPGAPHSLKANSIGSTGIMLQWSSNAGRYDIYIRDKAGRPVPEAPDITGGATHRNCLEFFNLSHSSLKGLLRKPTAPASSICARMLSSKSAAMPMIGMRRPSAIKRLCSSTPLKPGICTSVIRHDVSSTRADSRKSSADANVATAYPRDRTSAPMALRTALVIIDN